MSAAVALAWQSAAIGYRALYYFGSIPAYLSTKVASPILQVATFSLVAQSFGHDPRYAALGNAVQTVALSGLFGPASAIGGDRAAGTLSLLLASPASRLVVLAGRALIHVGDAALGSAITVAFSAFAFGLPLGGNADAPAALLALGLTIISVSAFGLTLGSLSLTFRETLLVANLAYWAMFALAGVVTSIDQLPTPLQWVSRLLPLTFGLDAIRGALLGDLSNYPADVLVESLHGLLFLIAALWLYRRFERLAIQRGALDFA